MACIPRRPEHYSQPHGLSNGSEAPNPPAGFVVAGVAADVHPPKSSSAVTVGCVVDLLADEIGAPHPPDMSFGVIRLGTLPNSTFGAAGFAGSGVPHPPDMSFGVIRDGTLPSSTFGAAGLAGSGAPHALVSAPPQGSNMLELECEATAVRAGCGAGAGLGAVVVVEDKLKAELKAGGLWTGGDETFATGTTGGLEGADVKSLKPSSANKSAGMDVVGGLAAGGGGAA